jgi:hypothetical protein
MPTITWGGVDPGDVRIDREVGVDPLTGRVSARVPLDLTDGRDGFGPRLTLRYDSTGAQHGPYGVGWALEGLLTVAVSTRRAVRADGTTALSTTPTVCRPVMSYSIDALGNATRTELDYHVAEPTRVTDANGNVTEALLDPLGIAVVSTAHGPCAVPLTGITEAPAAAGLEIPGRSGDRAGDHGDG